MSVKSDVNNESCISYNKIMSLIKPLHDVSLSDITQVGGKAAALGELMQIGVPVPSGFVITTAAFRSDPSALQRSIRRAFTDLGVNLVAVRSSAVAEDSEIASWAGQLESYLNVPEAGLTDAVKACRASINSARARAYAAEHQTKPDSQDVAVIVQTMVPSGVSGVMFTANPVSGRRDEIIIEAIYGLGELLVQGAVTPESFIVKAANGQLISHQPLGQSHQLAYRDGRNQSTPLTPQETSKSTLTKSQIQQLVTTSQQLETHFGRPQDIEWAIHDEKLWIIQSRPITTLPSATIKDTGPITTPQFELLITDYQVIPFVVSRLAYIMAVRAGRYVTSPPECLFDFHDSNVYWYAEIPKWDVAAQEIIARLLTRPASFIAFNRALRRDIDQLKTVSRDLYSADLSRLTSAQFAARHRSVMRLYERVYERGIIPTYSDLGTPYLTTELTARLTTHSANPAADFVTLTTPTELSEIAQEELALLRLATDQDVQTGSPVLTTHQQCYFWLTYGYAGPVYKLADIERRLRDYRANPAAAARRHAQLAGTPGATAATIKVLNARLPVRLQRSFSIARDWVLLKALRKEAFFLTYAAMGHLAAELSRRYQLPKELINFLTNTETQALIRQGRVPDNLSDRLEAAVYAYRDGIEQVMTGPSAATFLRQEVKPPAADVTASAGGVTLTGQIAFVGRATGFVRIINQPADLPKMQPGDILVSSVTNPNLMPAMRQAAAFVTDVGGITCHAAIVARELQKPCIIGTRTATKVLHDGDIVEVDATTGIITLKAA